MDQEAARWLYSLELTNIYPEDERLETAERITAQIYGEVFHPSGTTFPKPGIATVEEIRVTEDLTIIATRIGVDDLDISQADTIARRLQESAARHMPQHRTKLEVTVRPEFDAEISPLTIALGLNESAWLAPNSSASPHSGEEFEDMGTTTSDLVNFHLLIATIRDPNLSMIHPDDLMEDLIEASSRSKPAMRAESAGDTLIVPAMNPELVNQGLLKRLDLWLSTFEEPTVDHLYAYLGFIAAVVADYWPLVATAETKSTYHDSDIETKVYLYGVEVAGWSVGRDGDDAFGPANVPDGHEVHISHLPSINTQMSLLTLAIRHAEIHVLGTEFKSPCKPWVEAVHGIADYIKSDLADLPKWRGLFEDE